MTTITLYAERHTAHLYSEAAARSAREAAIIEKCMSGKPIAEAFANAAVRSLGETFNENLTASLVPWTGPAHGIGAYMPEDYCGRFAINVTRSTPRKILTFLGDVERVVTAGYLNVKVWGSSLDAFMLEAHPGMHSSYQIASYDRNRSGRTSDATEMFKKGVGVALAENRMAGFLRNLKL